MSNRRLVDNPLFLGLLVGLVFGLVNLFFTWLYPLDDDSPGALLRFYGPMFLVWRSSPSERLGVAGGCCQA